eukprot:451334-Amphidinium_carterae.1
MELNIWRKINAGSWRVWQRRLCTDCDSADCLVLAVHSTAAVAASMLQRGLHDAHLLRSILC